MRYDEFSRPLPDCEKYLARLGVFDGTITQAPSLVSAKSTGANVVSVDIPTRELLDALVFAHQTRIPFDAIDSHDFKKPANLNINVLFDKIIQGSRGGFCFELGALFSSLLKELGFSTAPCIARNVRAQEDFPPIMHRAELVDIQGVRHYADVGYGGPMAACSIPLIDGASVESCGQRFFMRKAVMPEGLEMLSAEALASSSSTTQFAASTVDPWWLIEYQTRSMLEPAPLIYFLDAAMKPQDFDPLSFYCSAHPRSVFVLERLVNIRTPDGSKSIRNMVFTCTSAAGTTQRTLENHAELQQVLQTEFGITVTLSYPFVLSQFARKNRQ